MQNSFVKLWEAGDFTLSKVSLKSFLFTTTKNSALDIIKHRKIKEQFINAELNNVKNRELELVEEALRNFAFEEVDKNNLINRVRKVVFQLPLSDRKIFILSKYNNLTNKEIADILEISSKTVEKRLKLSLLFIKRNFVVIVI